MRNFNDNIILWRKQNYIIKEFINVICRHYVKVGIKVGIVLSCCEAAVFLPLNIRRCGWMTAAGYRPRTACPATCTACPATYTDSVYTLLLVDKQVPNHYGGHPYFNLGTATGWPEGASKLYCDDTIRDALWVYDICKLRFQKSIKTWKFIKR